MIFSRFFGCVSLQIFASQRILSQNFETRLPKPSRWTMKPIMPQEYDNRQHEPPWETSRDSWLGHKLNVQRSYRFDIIWFLGRPRRRDTLSTTMNRQINTASHQIKWKWHLELCGKPFEIGRKRDSSTMNNSEHM